MGQWQGHTWWLLIGKPAIHTGTSHSMLPGWLRASISWNPKSPIGINSKAIDIQLHKVRVGCISTESFDFDLNNLKSVVWNATQKGVQFIFMGSKMTSADGALEYLQKELKDETVRFINKYDEALLHLIFAGSDIILCQTFHDPLLQVPLKALKYGAAPIAVTSNENNFRDFVDHEQETTRFAQFISSTFGCMSLSQAVDEIKSNPSKWKQTIADAMVKDLSWNAECYDVHVSAYTAIKSESNSQIILRLCRVVGRNVSASLSSPT
ncbi:unnamed protein product [Dovyalis caffra]|uniref:starch synthase n=1 Tax=Dovyalis caffra TaxID=77055 RepID=A0AAV1RSK7_9ROSI|nr:unnamed protein product [Dovyalis caffra]